MINKSVNLRNNVQMVDLEGLVPQDHLLRKIDAVVDFTHIYDLVEDLYCADNGRPSIDPVVLVKMVMIQHLYGIKSLRQTVKEIDMNIAYRWFLGYDFGVKIPHFSTISYNFSKRFTGEIFEEIFSWILEAAIARDYVKPEMIFIDATHIKANANKKKNRKIIARKAARAYDEQLRKEINEDRELHDKKPLKDHDDDNSPPTREITVSTVDPECGLFHKGEHKKEMAYTTHTACDKNNFILGFELTAGNIHDSLVFDKVYDKVTGKFENVKIIVADAGYKTPWICKKVFDSGRVPSMPYKRPMSKKGFFFPYEYVYDEYYNCVICPNNQVLPYVTTNKEGYREFKSDPSKCTNCPHLYKCTESKNHQKVVAKHIWEKYIDEAEHIRHSPIGKESYALRSQTIERIFADAKEKYGMRYTFYRGLTKVANWVRLKFACMNLKKLAMWAWKSPCLLRLLLHIVIRTANLTKHVQKPCFN
jgi:transposase